MQFLEINKTTSLIDLTGEIGSGNVAKTLHLNGLKRVPKIGEAFYNHINDIIKDVKEVTNEKKTSILNTMTGDSDVFEMASLMGQTSWKAMIGAGTFPNMLRIPDDVKLPDSTRLLGNGEHITHKTYNAVINSITNPPHYVDPSLFNTYNTKRSSSISNLSSVSKEGNPMNWFNLPWGQITLHSRLNNTDIQFPVYPEEISDKRSASYTQMPDLLYQYEPWLLYQSSGPRTNTYTFSFHRDMWTGDHKDGKANELIRSCMACCYPEYKGSAVYPDIVELYVSGKLLITGVVTDVSANWDGPLGHDGFYLHCTLTLTITEISNKPLTNKTVKELPLIG